MASWLNIVISPIERVNGSGAHFRLGGWYFPASTEKFLCYVYVTLSARKCSCGTLGYAQQTLVTVLKARGRDTILD